MEKKERKTIHVEDGEKAKKAAAKAAEEAEDIVEDVEEEIEEVEEEVEEEVKPVKKAKKKTVDTLSKEEEKKTAKKYRIIAIALWVAALCFEVLAILVLFKALYIPVLNQMWQMIIFIILDLICCVIAASFWKKASHLDPFKKTDNKVGFVILTQLGVIMAAICFLPLIILLLTSKNKLDKKTKVIVAVVAIIAMLGAGLLSADWNPISAEEKAQAENTLTGTVYWTAFGHKYHLYDDCQALTNSATLYDGSVTAAIDNGRAEVCFFCARRAEAEGTDMTGINVEEVSEDVALQAGD